VTDFDLFMKVDQHLVLYSGLGYKWQLQELSSLLASGFDHFLVKTQDATRVEMYLQLAQLPKFDATLPPKERIGSIEKVAAQFLQCLYTGEITPACFSRGEEIASSIVSCISEDPSCVHNLQDLSTHDYYTYFHSVRVAVYAVAIASKLGQTKADLLREIALGCIFHDVGKKAVPLDVLHKSGPLTGAEWEIMKQHPQQGLKLISETILSHVPREIILHHHEKLDGTGYPDGLEAKSLLTEVQIAATADVFDALTSARSYQQKRSRFEALEFMKDKMLGTKISRELFNAMVGCLAA